MLALCADAGLATVGVIAIDGTKVAANANRDRTMDYEQLAQAIVEEAIATDAAETAALGERRGDELPEIVAQPTGPRGVAARRPAAARRSSAPSEPSRSRARGRQRLLEAKRRLEEELGRRARTATSATRPTARAG